MLPQDLEGVLNVTLLMDGVVQLYIPTTLLQRIIHLCDYCRQAGRPDKLRVYDTGRQHSYCTQIASDVCNI